MIYKCVIYVCVYHEIETERDYSIKGKGRKMMIEYMKHKS